MISKKTLHHTVEKRLNFYDLQVYIIGGVGDKRYYNDIWVFDICTCSWAQLDFRGQPPQGRFSHTAVVADMDIAIYGGLVGSHLLQFNKCEVTIPIFFSISSCASEIFFLISHRCGEDERPLNELLVLQLGAEHPNGRYNISMCKVFGTYWNQEKRIMPRGADTNSVQKLLLRCSFKFLFISWFIY